MPFKSEKQRRYMHANHPKIAKRWERKGGTKSGSPSSQKRSSSKRRKR